MEYDKLVQKIQDLERKVADMDKQIQDSTKFQEDFGKEQVFRREVRFYAKVKDATGATVIN